MSAAVLLLAAGQGRRFGSAPKLLAPLRGKPLIRHAAEAAVAAAIGPVHAVFDPESVAVAAAVGDLPIRRIDNPRAAEGLSTSLQAGFDALPAEVRAVVVMLGDMPDVPPAILQGLVARWRASDAAAVVPVTGGRRANPVLIDRRIEAEIVRLRGDIGASGLLRGRSDVLEWRLDEPGLLHDVDTPDQLA